MAGFPSVRKGNKLGEVAKQPRPGIPLTASVPDDEIARLLRHYHGNISRVADKLGTTRNTLRRRIDNNPELRAIKEETRERLIDDLEECSWHKALQGDTIMQLFLLKTIGKSRGYDQNDNSHAAQDVARAAFDFVLNRSKNPVTTLTPSCQPNQIESN